MQGVVPDSKAGHKMKEASQSFAAADRNLPQINDVVIYLNYSTAMVSISTLTSLGRRQT